MIHEISTSVINTERKKLVKALVIELECD